MTPAAERRERAIWLALLALALLTGAFLRW
jgi:hypothetical protein